MKTRPHVILPRKDSFIQLRCGVKFTDHEIDWSKAIKPSAEVLEEAGE